MSLHPGRSTWPLISVVVITYNRVHLLRETLRLFRECCTYPNLEIIISDNWSKPEQIHEMLRLEADYFVISGRNRSLGGNNNQAIRQARGEYVFYLQNDLSCTLRSDWMQDALWVLEHTPEVGLVMVRGNDYIPNFQTRRFPDGREFRVLDFEQPNVKHGHYVYNDGPQLKRRDLHDKVGWYLEDIPIGDTEDFFALRFSEQRKYAIATIDYRATTGRHLFEHEETDFESTRPDRWRHRWKHRLEESVVGAAVMGAYKALPRWVRKPLRRSAWIKRESLADRWANQKRRGST